MNQGIAVRVSRATQSLLAVRFRPPATPRSTKAGMCTCICVYIYAGAESGVGGFESLCSHNLNYTNDPFPNDEPIQKVKRLPM